jgi:hypothetical protein
MLIDEPHVRVDAVEVTVEAAVSVDAAGPARPPSLFFAFPRAFAAHVTPRADAFAAALLPLAMRLREPVELRGELSCRLAQGMRDWQSIQHAWKPEFFGPVDVHCERLADRRGEEATGAVGAAFSGGVDSFHTLMEHRREREPYAPFAITHCLMINGFDRDADHEGDRFRRLQAVYEPLMAELGVTAVVARTNLLDFLDPWIQKQSFAAFVTAPALALGRLFARFYLPSSYKFTLLGMFPDGSHPMLDHLLSTETMETIHDGAHLTRVEKTVAISTWPATYDRLRVCFGANGVRGDGLAVANCCDCEKCLRTMVTLELAGALGRYTCFPRPLQRAALSTADYRWPGSRVFAEEIIAYASSLGRGDVVRDLRRAVRRGRRHAGPARARLDRLVCRLSSASHGLESRSPLWASLVGPPKRAAKRAGWGRGWLY